ncbi:argininosuccinate lyase [Xylophilus sp. GOD-11R]|uniref:argininosuccinate lyase n=1 Tax=Xylophilus sp. GOD-11R TaxID=3089814 RepID=UPI00298BCC11|nr:argininosuccinate lyase [Xylophilus sp. GOD-11R]WPB55554.1 argininosuccinate lyase [Xylophilus sp. GOD-11R]
MSLAPASKVSRRLTEGTAVEVTEDIYAPRLARDFPAVFEPLNDVNQAHLLMLLHTGLIPAEPAAQLAQALQHIEREGVAAVPLDPSIEDAYFNYEAWLMEVAGAHVGGYLHMARSRNDILATMDRLRARELALSLIEHLCRVRDSALEGALAHRHVVMPGYTHLQPAQPISYGFYLAGIAEAIGRDIERVRQAERLIDLCPLGAGALAGTSFPIDRAETARLLGFAAPVPHALDAVASRDFALELLSAMTICAVGWSRFAQDWFVWCTGEFGLIDFPDRVAGTSSIMPQKKNPVVLEYLKGKAGHLIGLLTASLATIKGVNFSHTGDASREGMRSFWEAGEECLRCLRLLDLVVRTATPNAEAMARRVRRDFSSATDLADLLVRRCGLSFRESHHVVGAVVRLAMDAGLGADEIGLALLNRAAHDTLQHPLDITDAEVRQSLDPMASVAARLVPGGPAPIRVEERVAELQRVSADDKNRNKTRRTRSTEARQDLKRNIQGLALQTMQRQP